MSWLDRAACKPYPLDVFFPAPGCHHLAVKICQGCPVQVQCIEDARATEDPYDPHGIRGGLTAAERLRQRRASPRRGDMTACPECELLYDGAGLTRKAAP